MTEADKVNAFARAVSRFPQSTPALHYVEECIGRRQIDPLTAASILGVPPMDVALAFADEVYRRHGVVVTIDTGIRATCSP